MPSWPSAAPNSMEDTRISGSVARSQWRGPPDLTQNLMCTPLRLTRFQIDPHKSAKLLYRYGNRSRRLVGVKLDSLRSRPRAGVLDVEANVNHAFGMDLRRIDAKITVIKMRVTQTVAEGIERGCRHIHITAFQPVSF